MRIIIKVGGEIYTTPENNDVLAGDAANTFRKNIDRMSSISLELSDGSYIVLGEDLLKRAVFIFTE